MNTTDRKPYHAPTLARHGSAVQQTRGIMGINFEWWGWSRFGQIP